MTIRQLVLPAALVLSAVLAAQDSNESKPTDAKPAPAQAQGGQQRHLPPPKNLQILPKDISEENLFAVMKNFATSLGWRCSNCHVGEEGKPLSTYDFASDAKKEKGRAREMMKIAGEINKNQIPKLGMKNPQMVTCWTCHRGHNEPESKPAGAPGQPGQPEHHHDHDDHDHDHGDHDHQQAPK